MANFFDLPTPFFRAPENVTLSTYMKNMNFGVEGRVIVHLVGINE